MSSGEGEVTRDVGQVAADSAVYSASVSPVLGAFRIHLREPRQHVGAHVRQEKPPAPETRAVLAEGPVVRDCGRWVP